MNTRPDAVDDLVLLRDNDINNRGIVNVLRNRYNEDNIYTYIGPVLLSVNPFKNIPNFYSDKMIQKFYGKFKFEEEPHVFASAEDAHRKLMSTGINQCVLISGESGAGKTEAAKKVMEYVSKVSSDTSDYAFDGQNQSKQRYSRLDRSVVEIKDSLLKSNPVLEAFGNAKTIRNDNSSRFGKYMEIQMDYNGTPLGGRITNYLLEKPRVVHQGQGERNFHIFYQLTNGMDQRHPMYSQLYLGNSQNFFYCSDNAAADVRTINDHEWFQEMDAAMASVGIRDDNKFELFKTVAAVLWLGNVQFVQKKTNGQDACAVNPQSGQALKTCAHLLQVGEQDLTTALTTRSRETKIDQVRSPLVKVDECDKVRDALAKALYSRLFQKLVELINKTIFTPVSELSLGVLDIYGFEIFQKNSFEQLCINYCNEKLQQYFIQLTLKAEQEEYASEGIPWRDIDYFNNKIVCDLIESKRPPGIIAFLDEQIMLNRDEDLSFLNKMNKQIGNPHYMIPPSNTSQPTEFVIRHYAGDVIYSAEGMIDKNKDTLFRDLLVLCGKNSRSNFIRELFPEGREQRDMKRPVTAGTQFVADMNQLIENLEKCEPHYIRCIKPNDDKRSGYFVEDRVEHQVKYLGLLENVKVRRAGYAYRRKYDLFVRRYKMLSPRTWPKPPSRDDVANTELILREAGINPNEYAKGKTKVFIEKPGSLFELERQRQKAMDWVVALIQRAFRRWKLRLYFQKIRELAVNLLHGKKRRTKSWIFYYLGDYLNASSNEAVMDAVRTHGDQRIVFADEVSQHNFGKVHSETPIFLIMTPRSFLVFNSLKATKGKAPAHKRIGFEEIDFIGFSTFADNFVYIGLKPQVNGNKMTPQPGLLLEAVHKSEIATAINEEWRASQHCDAPLRFSDQMTITVMSKKGGIGGMFSKPKALTQNLSFYEDPSFSARNKDALLIPMSKKKGPTYNPDGTKVAVSPKLGSRADLQLNAPLPERVIAHTAIGRQGKKQKRVGRRRQY